MDLPEAKKSNDCEEDCECKDCEMRAANDEKNIFVSVSPRRFELPKSTDKKAKMKIENNNPHPIYFRASTSNMDVFRPFPDNGHIAPNSKTCLDVQFYDSVVPLRRHEEVIVFTSVKPFELPPMYKERVCPFCMEPFDISKNHVPIAHSHTDECLPNSDHEIYQKKSKPTPYKEYAENNTSHDDFEIKYKAPKQKLKSEYESVFRNGDKIKDVQEEYKQIAKLSRNAAKDYAEKKASRYDDFEMKYKAPKQKFKTEYESKPGEYYEAKKKPEEYKKEITQKTKDYEEKHPKKSDIEEKKFKKRDRKIAKTGKPSVSHSMEEVCIHAQVHRPSDVDCECPSCLDLQAGKEGRKRQEDLLPSEEEHHDRRIKSEEYVSEDRLYDTDRDIQAPREIKDAQDKRKFKGKDAHIFTRVLGDKESLSDTDLSELSRDVLTGRTKIISVEDYMKKKEKMKKKLQKRHAEESESTAAADGKDQQKESDEKSTEKERKPTLQVLDEKCNTLINLSRANLFLVLLVLLTVVGGFTYCYSSRQPEESYLPCIYDIWQYFG